MSTRGGERMSRQIHWRAPELGEPKQIETGHGTIAYTEAGSGPPLVLVHGFLANANIWRKLVPRLSSHFRCFAVDWPLGSHYLPVRPDADLSPYGITSLIADFLERLALEHAIVLGNDSGGAYSQMVAATGNHRLSALVLNSCETPEDRWPPKGFGHLKSAAQIPGGLTSMVQSLRLRRSWRSPIAYGSLAKRPIEDRVMWSFLDPFFRSSAIRRDARKVISSVGPEYHRRAAETLIAEFERPVIFAWAEEDRVFPLRHAQTYAAALANARVQTLEDSYTYVAEDNPARLAEVLVMALGSVPAA
jgi:pimeloyl-ACP methyl ester carboxylesterase